jgi:hypothetical protein
MMFDPAANKPCTTKVSTLQGIPTFEEQPRDSPVLTPSGRLFTSEVTGAGW